MTEEKKPEEKKPEEKPEEKPAEKNDKVEELAIKLGWNPDHEGGEREYVSAEKYILRSREIQDTSASQLRSTKRQVGDLERGLEALKKHNEKVYEVQVANLKKEVRTLKKQRKEAQEDGDTQTVKEIDKEIDEINKIPAEAKVPDTKNNPDFEKWLDKNPWYMDNKEMRIYADMQGNSQDLTGLPASKFYSAITKRVKEQFPEFFEPKLKPEAPPVEGPTPRKKIKKPKFTKKDLSDAQKKNCEFFVDRGVMTEEKYIEDLEKIGQLK